MLLLIPILLYAVSALAIAVWHFVRPGFGVPWLAAVAVTLAGWGLMIYLRLRVPVELAGQMWLGLGDAGQYPYFVLDVISWPYAFALCGLALAIVQTASARLAHKSNPLAWAASLALTSAGLVAVTAANPLTLAVSWTMLDVTEVVVLLATVRKLNLSTRVVVAFSARVVGTMVLVWAMLVARSQGIDLNFTQIPADISLVLILAAGLRLGVLPLHLTLREEIPMRRGLGVMLRSAAPASSLALLARLPAGGSDPTWTPVFLTLATLAVLYTAVVWLFSNDPLAARPYWLIAVSGLAVVSVLRGQPAASIAWGLAMLLPGGLLFLYSARDRGTLFFPLLGALGLSALPFTPASAGWLGLWAQPFDPASIFFLLAHVALLAGYLRHVITPGESLRGLERWVQGIYPFGLLMLVVTQWIAAWFSLPQSFALIAWVGVATTLLALAALAVSARLMRPSATHADEEQAGWVSIMGQRVGRWMGAIFRLDWVYRLGMYLYGGLRAVVSFLITILEGDGGVLWAMVLLALLISLLRIGGAP